MASMLSSSRTSAVSAVMARFASFLEFTVSQLFYFTKSLIVKTLYFDARLSLFTVTNRIVTENKQEASLTTKDHFLTTVTYLILASQEPKLSRENRYKTNCHGL